jgi:hypothetical protein
VSPGSGSSTGEHDTITVSIDTTGLAEGSHSCNVDISSNGGSGTFVAYVTVVPPVTEILDQEQTCHSYVFTVYGTRWLAQSFIPSIDSLTRLELYVSRLGSPPGDLKISIRSSLTGGDLSTMSVSPGSIPTSAGWVSFDIPDITVTIGSTYYIVINTSGGGSASNSYRFGFCSGNPYPNGMFYYSGNAGGTWYDYSSYDLSFRTYGGGGPPPSPALSYSPSSHDFGSILAGVTDSTTFDIWNSGTGTLTYSLSESCGWITSVSPGSGSSTGEHDTITVNIDTTGLADGDYSCNVDITSDGGSGTFTVDVSVVPVGAETLDQEQTLHGYTFTTYGSRWVAQSFTPSIDSLSSIELYVARLGSPPGDLKISIRSSLTGSELSAVSVSPGSIPTTLSWVSFDIPDITVTAGSTYYIVMNTSGGSTSNYFQFGFNSGDPYAGGIFHYSSNAGVSWYDYTMYDIAFRTYGIV